MSNGERPNVSVIADVGILHMCVCVAEANNNGGVDTSSHYYNKTTQMETTHLSTVVDVAVIVELLYLFLFYYNVQQPTTKLPLTIIFVKRTHTKNYSQCLLHIVRVYLRYKHDVLLIR